jgi:tRNA (guanine26-N2/guanine27-N2)-dimethyltransferase
MGDQTGPDSSPSGWPGQLWLEGRTLVHLLDEQSRPTHMPRGPAKRTGPGFLNPAMAPARTRSVMLLNDALEHGWLARTDQSIRILDALCATGVRVRRWRNEIPSHLQKRLRITANDLDDFALDWAKASHATHPPSQDVQHRPEDDRYGNSYTQNFENGLNFRQVDARIAMIETGHQWIDLDPFGSPVQFLDSALQGLSRIGVLEITATDTAALTGSSSSSQARRYGAKGIVDVYAHDDAVRLLLATVATAAARLDKAITPLLALFDGHHVRISCLVKTSREQASEIGENIGWRVREDDVPYRFVRHPTPEQVKRGSGPLWIGPLWDKKIASRMTEEKAIELCQPDSNEVDYFISQGLTWDEQDIEYSTRELRRSVRYISQAADLMSREHLLLNLDSLPKWAGVGGAPKIEKLILSLSDAGHAAARLPDIEPLMVTDAPFETVLQHVRKLSASPK